MSINVGLTHIQKVLLFLLANKSKTRIIHFQDIQEHLNRSKSQVSLLLTRMEEENLINRSYVRPQPIGITDHGEERIRNECIAIFRSYLFSPNKKKAKSKKDQEKNILKLKKQKILQMLNLATIQKFLEKMEEMINTEFGDIDDYVMKAKLNELKNTLIDKIDFLLSELFKRIKQKIK